MTLELSLYHAPYCPHCRQAGASVEQTLRAMRLDVTLDYRNVLDHIDAAVAAGVRKTPALTVNGRLVASGHLDPEDLERILSSAVSGAGG